MRKIALASIFFTGFLFINLAEAGKMGELYCSACGYRERLTIDGSRNAPSLTIYCSKCKKFSRKAFRTWSEANNTKIFTCPDCSGPASVYKGYKGFRCPKCGKDETKFEVLRLFD